MTKCQKCEAPIHLDFNREVTFDWQFHTFCGHCGTEQFGSLYFGVLPATNIPSRTSSGAPNSSN
jgi:hypothetical protein